jgi:Transcriptional regulator
VYEHIDLARIPIFLTVAENLSFTEAAFQLYTTQSSISKSISALESSLGFSLFIRKNRKIILTPEGEYLYHALCNTMQDINDAFIYASKIHEGRNGMISIGTSGYLPKTPAFENICFKFNDLYPTYDFDQIYMLYSKKQKVLLDGKVDAILSNNHDVGLLHGYRYLPIMVGYAILATNPLLNKDTYLPLSAEKLSELQFVSINPDIIPSYYGYLISCCEAYGFKPQIAKFVNSIHEVTNCISTSKYVSIFDKTIFPMDFSNLDMTILPHKQNMPEPLSTLLIWNKNNTNPALREFIDLAIDITSSEIGTINTKVQPVNADF